MDVGRGGGEKEKIRQGDTKNVEEEEKEKDDTRCREQNKTGILIQQM
jgi:hypothetical protein